jgi:hypothetical protein
MPRLIDDLRADRRIGMPWFIAPHLEAEWQKHTRQVLDLLSEPQLPVLLLDNVADYLYTGSDQEHWDLRDDFPNLAPPYPQFWAEHRMPTKIHSREKGDTDVTRFVQHGRIGALITAVDPKQARIEGPVPENVRWILWCELFVDYGDRAMGIQGSHGAVFFAIDSEGVLVDRPWMQSFTGGQHADEMRSYISWFNPTLLAISFLHCKNVTVVDNRVPVPLAKKYRARHGGASPCSYKTLVIEPLKKILRSEGQSDRVGVQKALHICRGHFKDYREGRGLFGKYHQLVWQPSIVRGSKGKSAPPREIQVKI